MPLSPNDPEYQEIMRKHSQRSQQERKIAYERDQRIKDVRKNRK